MLINSLPLFSDINFVFFLMHELYKNTVAEVTKRKCKIPIDPERSIRESATW